MPRGAFSDLWIWEKVGDRLPWYYQVANNRMPAKYLIAKRIPCKVDLEGQTEEALWSEHARATDRFLKLWREVRAGNAGLRDLSLAEPSLLDLSAELTVRMLQSCTFCRWRCRIDRSAPTKHGTCQLESKSRVSSYFHHQGEEIVFRGTQGSGTVFFTSCNLRCSFCLSETSFVMTTGGPRQISDLYEAAGFETEFEGGYARFPDGLRVQSGEGEPVRVTKIFKHTFRGTLLQIKALYAPPISLTLDHEVIACLGPDGDLSKMPARDLTTHHFLAIPRALVAESRARFLDVAGVIGPLAERAAYKTGTRLPALLEVVSLSEMGATSTEVSEATGYHPSYVRTLLARIRREGLPKLERTNGIVLEDGRIRLKTERKPGIPAHLVIDNQLAEFLGYYCAEGHTEQVSGRPSTYTVQLTFGKHEADLVMRTAHLIRELFHLEPSIRERRTAVAVVVCKASLGLLLKTLCGSHATDKEVPGFLFKAPPDVVESFLEAYVAGDGSITSGYVSMNTVSPKLAMGLFALYLQLGHLPTFNVFDPPKWALIEGRRVRQSRRFHIRVHAGHMENRDWEGAKGVRYRFRGTHVLVPIHRISREAYEGPVFNLEVDDDGHSFAANFVAVGNCQNGDISHDKENGVPMTPAQLASVARQLRTEGCHNINWVGGDPTIHLHNIVQAIALLAEGDGETNVPMLWNSNFFMSGETMRILRPLIDVWLPDFKFGSDKCSVFLARTPWYWETVSQNHQLVYDWGEDMVIRHLVMPNHVDCCTKPVMEWIANHAPQALVNVMDQYHPDYACNPTSPSYDPQYEELARRPYDHEIREAYDLAASLGLRFEDVTFERA